MAAVDYTKAKTGLPAQFGAQGIFFLKDRFDFSVTPLLNANSAELFAIPAGCEVRNVWVKIVTPETAADTFDIGITDGGVEFENAGAANGVAGTVTRGVGGTDAGVTANGQFYATAGYIFLVGSADLSQLVIDVVVEVAKIF
jgi:hypothetical protein